MNARVAETSTGEATPVEITPKEIEAKPKKRRRSGSRIALMVSVPLVLAAAGGWMWLSGGRYVETDNAYVHQPVVAISADVAGRVVEVAVRNDEAVKAGQTLFSIDSEPYRIALDQAEAALASARVNIEQLRVAYATAKVQLDAAKETLAVRKTAFDRKASLAGQGLAAEATLDDVRLAYQAAESQVALAEQQVASAAAALAGNPDIDTEDHPAVRAARAARDAAERNLRKTTVVAPADGIVSQVASLNVGQFVSVGTTIASLVEANDAWIDANYKETQLATIEPGMPVEVAIDAYPGTTFAGHVESIGAATGSEFALIPAQNATGNWVKVTQRVPVRISVDDTNGRVLRAGMSAVVTVDTKGVEG